MNARPWQVSALVFVVLTLLYWSDFQVGLTVRGFPIQAYFPQSPTLASSNTPTAVPVSPNVKSPFPKVDTSKSPKTNLTAILLSSQAKKIQDQIIPKENSTSPYGLKFSLTTFNTQKDWQKNIAVDPSWKDRYDSITNSTYHPCCGATIATNDCGHALAMTGLVKKMLQDGKSDPEIRVELLKWEEYYFPRHYVIVALALQKMGQSFNKADLSANYSSEDIEGPAGNYLIYN